MSGEEKGIKMLHVDDEPDFLALTKAIWERENENFSIVGSTSAEEGIKLLKSGKFDAVISDYKMPGNGWSESNQFFHYYSIQAQ
ncbi:MAG: hypothetical protein U9N01_05845 [Euryarchaeota archaeon]|nr:hypothetical protein [Euryarchaeota archaeon]